MGQKLLVTILMLVTTVSFAQHERYQQQAPQYGRPAQVEPEAGNDGYEEIETVENNLASGSQNSDGEVSQIDNFKGNNSATNTDGSPQINIYNANSNANKQKAEAAADGEAESKVDTYSQTNVGENNGNYASDIKNSRKQMEYRTDEKVIEKLEWSRMEDEKDRADRLFGNRLEKNYNNDYKQKEEYSKPPVVVVEKPVYAEPKTEVPYAYKEEVKTETSYALWDQQSYIAPMLGSMSSSAGHVSSDLATGIAFGTHFATNFSVEASFLYSDIKMDGNVNELIDGKVYEGFKSGEQYSFGMGVAYHFTQMGKLTPKISGLLAYTYRDMDQTRSYQASATSTAVDAGVGVGADLQVSKNFSIGAELRWMSNLSYDRDNSELDAANRRYGRNNYGRDYRGRSSAGSVSPLEEASYQMFLVNGRFNF